MYIIEKGIPLPSGRVQRESGYREAVAALEVGDSFAFAINPKAKTPLASKAQTALAVGKPLGRKYVLRVESPDTGRIWRKA